MNLRQLISFTLAGVVLSTGAQAQSVTKGSLSGSVLSGEAPVWDARVILIDRASGVQRSVLTGIDGRFTFRLLNPADYEVRIEKIPYGPVSAIVPILPRRSVVLPPVQLSIVELPVHELSTFPFAAGAVDAGRSGNSHRAYGSFSRAMAARSLTGNDLSRLVGVADDGLGLPARSVGTVLEGVPVTSSFSPVRRMAGGPDWLIDESLSAAEYVFNPIDVEFAGSMSGYLVGYPVRGGRDFVLRAQGDFAGAALTSASRYDVPGFSSIRAGALMSGALVPDTAHFALGFQFKQEALPRPAAWRNRALDATIPSVANDSFNVDLGRYAQPTVHENRVFSGFGRVDAQLGRGTVATVTTGFGLVQGADPALTGDFMQSFGASYEAFNIGAIGTIASGQVGGLRQEFRAGFSLDRREFLSGTGTAPTVLSDAFAQFGVDPALPGETRSTSIFASENLYVGWGRHLLKIGLGPISGRTAAHWITGERAFSPMATSRRGKAGPGRSGRRSVGRPKRRSLPERFLCISRTPGSRLIGLRSLLARAWTARVFRLMKSRPRRPGQRRPGYSTTAIG